MIHKRSDETGSQHPAVIWAQAATELQPVRKRASALQPNSLLASWPPRGLALPSPLPTRTLKKDLCEFGQFPGGGTQHANLQLRIFLLSAAKCRRLVLITHLPVVFSPVYTHIHLQICIKKPNRKANKCFTVNFASFPSKASKRYFD